MKIVINGCFGGFGLSTEAMKMYAERKGLKHVKSTPHFQGDKGYDLLTPNHNLPDVITDKQWNDPKNNIHSDRDIPRTDSDLIAVVEKLKTKANGWVANLSVVEIPDGISYEITDYDGVETVEETHRSWS